MKKQYLLIGVAALSFAEPNLSLAQEPNESLFNRDRNVSVKERSRPEYGTDGVIKGAWRLRPEIVTQIVSDDNIFASENNTENDFIGIITPRIDVESTWSVHALRAGAELSQNEYFDFGSESVTNYRLNVDGELDFGSYSFIAAGADYVKSHEPRTAAGAANRALQPVEFDVYQVYISTSHETGRTQFQAFSSVRNFNYFDAELIEGGFFDQDFRDSDEINLQGRVAYAVSPALAVFGRVKYLDRTFESNTLPQSRDQDGMIYDVGASFDVTNLIRGEIGLGYFERSFDSGAFQNVDGFSVDGSVDWFVTPLITVGAKARRGVEVSALLNSPAFIDTGLSAAIDYEYRRNIILSAGAEFNEEDYQVIDRKDERKIFYVNGEYLMNRYISASIGIEQQSLNSIGESAQTDFDKTRLVIGVKFRR